MEKLDQLINTKLEWQPTNDATAPYTATGQGEEYTIEIGEFPCEPLYKVFVQYPGGNKLPIGNLDDWPANWGRPELKQFSR